MTGYALSIRRNSESESLFLPFLVCLTTVLASFPLFASVEDEPVVVNRQLVEEVVITEPLQRGDTFSLSADGVKKLLEGDVPALALRLADQALGPNRVPATVRAWMPVKVAAHLQLGRFDEVTQALESLPESMLEEMPHLYLMFADGLAESGRFSEAKKRYGRFLLAHHQGPDRYKAQLGVGLCALESGSLAEAAIQLELYEGAPGRPTNDPLLIAAQAALAEQQEQKEYADTFLAQLTDHVIDGVADPVSRRWSRRIVIRLLEARGTLLRALYQAESLLKEGGGRSDRQIHRRLFRAWQVLQDKKSTSKTSKADKKSYKQLIQRLKERNDLIHRVLDGTLKMDARVDALYTLFKNTNQSKLGLLAPGGLLQPEQLGLPLPLDPKWRLYYARYSQNMGLNRASLAWLDGLVGVQADGIRLLLFSRGIVQPGETMVDIVARLDSVEKVSEGMAKKAITALFRLQERGLWSDGRVLSDWLKARGDTPAIRGASRFFEARYLEAEKVFAEARMIYLALYLDPIEGLDGSFYPEQPRLAAARMLEAEGFSGDADDLRRMGSSAAE
ncbi:MAG: tetratricopeptide repeat protein [Magnetococcales bacterium]|nr:tetratricopeptide repeat protein [Magnetococcales bacterium]